MTRSRLLRKTLMSESAMGLPLCRKGRYDGSLATQGEREGRRTTGMRTGSPEGSSRQSAFRFELARRAGLLRLLGHRPDVGQHTPEVAAEDAADVGVAVFAANETLGEIVDALRVIDALDVDLVAEGVAPLVTGLESLVLLGRHVVVAVEIDVAADAEVLRPDELRDVI